MERASRLIGKLGNTISTEELARAAWPSAVGRRIAARTRAWRMVRASLIVEVEDAVWQRQLNSLRRQILNNLERKLGPGAVTDLEFRIVPRRIEPQRATQAGESEPLFASADEADQIRDPVLRLIYRRSRKKALA